MKADRVFRALAYKHRLGILFWLQNPRGHFPPLAGRRVWQCDQPRKSNCGFAGKVHKLLLAA